MPVVWFLSCLLARKKKKKDPYSKREVTQRRKWKCAGMDEKEELNECMMVYLHCQNDGLGTWEIKLQKSIDWFSWWGDKT